MCSPEDKQKLLCTVRNCKARTLKTRVVSKPCLINTGLSPAPSLVISEFQGVGEITRGLFGPTLVVFGKQNTVRVLAGKFVPSLGKQTKKQNKTLLGSREYPRIPTEHRPGSVTSPSQVESQTRSENHSRCCLRLPLRVLIDTCGFFPFL